MTETNREDLAWELVREEHLITDEWMDIRKVAYRLPDGTVFEPFYSYSRRSYVVVVAVDGDGKYLCVRQFRHGIRRVTTEFPAGGIERTGKTQYESPAKGSGTLTLTRPAVCPDTKEEALLAAKRELMEETGYVSADWTHLLTIPSNATIADNYAHLFLARSCKQEGEQHLDSTEFLDVYRYDAAEIEEMIRTEQFPQAMHVLAYELSKNHIK